MEPVFHICPMKWPVENIEESVKYLYTSLESHSWKWNKEIIECEIKTKKINNAVTIFSLSSNKFFNLVRFNNL